MVTRPKQRKTKEKTAEKKSLLSNQLTGQARTPDADADAQDVDLAREVLRAVARDKTAPAASRTAAARTLAEMAGALGRHSAPPQDKHLRPLGEMTREELLAELARSE